MPFTFLAFMYRLPGTTPDAFRAHYEGSHMPLFERIVGPLFPTKHTRSYIARTADAGHPATVLMGSQDDFAYDVMAELVFPDKAAFDAFIAKLSEEENKARIEADEKLWLDREKTRVVVLGETSVTEKEV